MESHRGTEIQMYSRALCQSIDDDGTRQLEGDVQTWHIIFDALVVILYKSLTSINERVFFFQILRFCGNSVKSFDDDDFTNPIREILA